MTMGLVQLALITLSSQAVRPPRSPQENVCGLLALSERMLPSGARQHRESKWPQWGGPGRDFKVAGTSLPEAWPAGGPAKLWERDLGDGFSSIVADESSLYTLYRSGEDEVVVAIDAATGKTRWERRYEAPLALGKKDGYLLNDPQFAGKGPRATPLLVGDRLYAVGYTAKFQCLDTKTGRVVWSRDLIRDLDAWIHECGYSSSPLAYGKTVITLLGSKEHAAAALDLQTGAVVWKSPGYPITSQESQGFHASPVLLSVEGEEQLVFMSPTEVIAFSPRNGEWKWSHPHVNRWKYNCVTPIGGEDGVLYVTSHSDGGSRGLQLRRQGDKTTVAELWHTSSVSLYHNNGIRLGHTLYGGHGAFVFAQDVRTGTVAWKTRGFSEALFVHAGSKTILLDEKGVLGLVTLAPEKMTVHSTFRLFDGKDCWAPPTLVGGTLYARDRRKMVALDVGKGR